MQNYRKINLETHREEWVKAYQECYDFCHSKGYVHMPSVKNKEGRTYTLAVHLHGSGPTTPVIGVYSSSYYDLAIAIQQWTLKK